MGVGELLEIFERAIVVARDAVAVGIHAAELPERDAVAMLGGVLQRRHARGSSRRSCSASVPLRIASTGDIAGDARLSAATGVPSSDRVGSIPKASAITAALARTLNIRIARLLGRPARMGDGAMQRSPTCWAYFQM